MKILTTEETRERKNGNVSLDESFVSRPEMMGEVDEEMSDKELKVIMRRIDFRVIPIAMFVNFFVILAASSLPAAKVAGMSKTLHMSDEQYHWGLLVYPIAHLLTAFPANFFLHLWGPRIWLSGVVMVGGIFQLCTGFVTTPGQVIAMRAVIGAVEAGVIPGILYVLSTLYVRKHLQFRIAMAVTGQSLAGITGGLLAYGITDNHSLHTDGWRIIFWVQGALTIVAAPIAYWFLPESIEQSGCLTDDQQRRYSAIRCRDALKKQDMTCWEQVRLFANCFWDLKTIMAIVLLFAVFAPGMTLNKNLPIILSEGFGFSRKQSQILGIPRNVFGGVTLLIVAYYNDKIEQRILIVAIAVFAACFGFFGALVSADGHLRYAMMLIAEGTHVAQPSAVMIMGQNIACDVRRSALFSITSIIVGLTQIVGSSLVWDKQAPGFVVVFATLLSFCFLALIMSGGLFLYLRAKNVQKTTDLKRGAYHGYSADSLKQLGEKSPYFVYKY